MGIVDHIGKKKKVFFLKLLKFTKDKVPKWKPLSTCKTVRQIWQYEKRAHICTSLEMLAVYQLHQHYHLYTIPQFIYWYEVMFWPRTHTNTHEEWHAQVSTIFHMLLTHKSRYSENTLDVTNNHFYWLTSVICISVNYLDCLKIL